MIPNLGVGRTRWWSNLFASYNSRDLVLSGWRKKLKLKSLMKENGNPRATSNCRCLKFVCLLLFGSIAPTQTKRRRRRRRSTYSRRNRLMGSSYIHWVLLLLLTSNNIYIYSTTLNCIGYCQLVGYYVIIHPLVSHIYTPNYIVVA